MQDDDEMYEPVTYDLEVQPQQELKNEDIERATYNYGYGYNHGTDYNYNHIYNHGYNTNYNYVYIPGYYNLGYNQIPNYNPYYNPYYNQYSYNPFFPLLLRRY